MHCALAFDYADEGGGAKKGIGTLGMDDGIGGSVTLGTAGIGGRVAAGTVGIAGTVTAGIVGTAGIGGTAPTAGTVGTAGIGGRATAGTVGTCGLGTAGMPGTAAGEAAGVVSARWRAAWHVLLPASTSAMASAVVAR
ncbi:hypothetical protein BS78_02G031400 [Paspalum vaginatum]|nr:hypothetical protein BS78_02G031400 [Paspalum vaginatum]